MSHRQHHGNGEGSPRVRGANKYRTKDSGSSLDWLPDFEDHEEED